MRGIKMGKKIFIGYGAILETGFPELITIGNNVEIGIRSTIIAHFKYEPLKQTTPQKKPFVVIEDNVYIGPHVLILPNVVIGEGSVVSAGSVVSKSVPPKTMVQGNPAKPIAKCGVPLSWDHSYKDFISNLRPIKKSG
jgi:acetyltransferase-like isoleucine patch superfamily enzyme